MTGEERIQTIDRRDSHLTVVDLRVQCVAHRKQVVEWISVEAAALSHDAVRTSMREQATHKVDHIDPGFRLHAPKKAVQCRAGFDRDVRSERRERR
jgi:hypothetical protein